ncbi:CAP domain-containing protein [Pyronema omphalodes]|nr:CAP domain-containing protein [Pyronema omphalodes]
MQFFTFLLSTLAITTGTLADFRNDYLYPHNQARYEHQVGGLQWDNNLAASAQRHANRCGFYHSGQPGVGENLAWGTYLGRLRAVRLWVVERNQFNFQNGGFSKQTGHFTQVVWKGTTRVGCAEKACNGFRMHVCQYYPPGNWQGQYRQNVFPRRYLRGQNEAGNGTVVESTSEAEELETETLEMENPNDEEASTGTEE